MRFGRKPYLASARVAFHAVSDDFSYPPRAVVKLRRGHTLHNGADPLPLLIPLSAARHVSNAQDVPEFTGPFLSILGEMAEEIVSGRTPAEGFKLTDSETARSHTRSVETLRSEEDLAEQMILRGLPWVWKSAPGRRRERVVEMKLVGDSTERVWATIDAPQLGPVMFGALAILALVEYMARNLSFDELVVPALVATWHVTERLATDDMPFDLLDEVDAEVYDIVRSPGVIDQLREEVAVAGEPPSADTPFTRGDEEETFNVASAEQKGTAVPGYEVGRLTALGETVRRIESAAAMGAWTLGPFEATLLGAIISEAPLGYRWGLAVDEGEKTRMFVAAETSELQEEVFLTVADGETHANLGAESDWTLISAFYPEALRIARESLSVDERPEPRWGLPVTWAQLES